MKNIHTYIVGILMMTLMLGSQVVSAQQAGLFPGNDTATADNTYPLGDISLSGATTPTTPTGTNTNTTPNPTTPTVPTGTNTTPTQNQTPASTQTNSSCKTGNKKYLICNPLGQTKSLKQVVLNVVNVVQVLLLMAAVLYLLYAGLMFVTARGESGKITKARNALLWGMVGIALVLAAQAIISAIEGTVSGILKK